MKRCCKLFALLAMILFIGTPVARATVHKYDAILDGPSESPPNASPGTGFTEVDYDDVAHTLTVDVSFSGLVGTTTASHIHAPTANPFLLTAGVATTTPTFAGFPLGVTSGTYHNVLDLTQASSYNPAFDGGAPATQEPALTAAIAAGKAYLNIHTSVFGGGEIRGFLVPFVPEPSTLTLAALGVAGVGYFARRRRS
jgi:CHRD domain/PEP-CTERM motif